MPLTSAPSEKRQENNPTNTLLAFTEAPPPLLLPTGLPGNLVELTRERTPGLRLVGTMLDITRLVDLIDNNQEQHLCEMWCNEQEQRQLQMFSLPKRRREWLAGRICAKQAIHNFLLDHSPKDIAPPRFTELHIVPTESGRPILQERPAMPNPPLISISHSGKFATALAASLHCGIDIQEIRISLAKIRPQFCSDKEYEQLAIYLPNHAPLERLALLWAGKEALRKATPLPPMPGFLAMRLVDVRPCPAQKSNLFTLILPVSHPGPKTSSSLAIQAAVHLTPGYATAVCVVPLPDFNGTSHA